MKSPEHNNNLDHLFNKAKAGKQDLDDFEKDALAGFDMLASEQEAKDVKASLDARIQKELFTKEEKNNPKIYWLAAAGLALVIGLSTFFVLNNNDSLSKSGNLAITNSEETKQEMLPESAKQLKEDATPPPPPLEAAAVADEKLPLQEEDKREQADKKEELKDLEQAVANTQEKKEPQGGISSRSVLKPANTGAKDANDFGKETTDRKKEANKSGENEEAVQNSKDANLDDLAATTSAKGKESPAYKAPVTTKQDQNADLAKTEASTKDVADKSSKEKTKSDKNAEADAKIISSEVATNGAGYANERREENKPKKTAKKTNNNHTTATAATPVYEETPGSPKSATTVAGDVNNTPVESKKDETTVTTCLYSGGETAINKELKTKLGAENLDRKFDATIYVNENKEVRKVEFTNAYDLTKKQKEDIIKILKSLNKFNFSTTPAKRVEYPYKVSYRP